jgi:hypothetical protein
MSIEQMFLM